jgi:hypothetical protein
VPVRKLRPEHPPLDGLVEELSTLIQKGTEQEGGIQSDPRFWELIDQVARHPERRRVAVKDEQADTREEPAEVGEEEADAAPEKAEDKGKGKGKSKAAAEEEPSEDGADEEDG